ncbi:hypothetical protein BDD12DRAFT_25310 [Trichophaea hybrida]|nr:hypothetical protein BDD12DRAFT_25310 [Trichophaea hybrida]
MRKVVAVTDLSLSLLTLTQIHRATETLSAMNYMYDFFGRYVSVRGQFKTRTILQTSGQCPPAVSEPFVDILPLSIKLIQGS